MTRMTNQFPTMAEYIKLHIFVPKSDDGPTEDKIIVTWVKHSSITLIQEVDSESLGFKSYVSIDGLDEGLRIVESAEEIVTAKRLGY